MSLYLKSARIQNFKSLQNVTLNFRDLTIIVGANASGKSNILDALRYISFIVSNGSPPPEYIAENKFSIGSQIDLSYKINITDGENEANYKVALSRKPAFSKEELLVNNLQVIDISNGEGKVYDEDGENSQSYKSRTGNLALKSAGDFGNKPFTGKVSEFIREWDFYDFDPDLMRREPNFDLENIIINRRKNSLETPKLDMHGSTLQRTLLYWSENDQDRFSQISQDLRNCAGIELLLSEKEGDKIIVFVEDEDIEVPLSQASDGTLRIIAYYILLSEDNLPPLIAIEEPERNLHPGILTEIASAIRKLSQRTQVIITTHSSQLLDCFTFDEISSDISVILLCKKGKNGTSAYQLDTLSSQQEDLLEWIQDFGVGNAIYHSSLIEECLV